MFCALFRIYKMENENLHHQHIMLFYFKRGKNAVKTCNKLCSVYGEDALTKRTWQKWFNKFRSGNLCVEESRRSRRRPTKIDTDKIKALVDENPHSATRNICDSLIERQQNRPFLKFLVTGNEKWTAHNNLNRKRSW